MVRRYDPFGTDCCEGRMVRSSDGSYVLFDDYKKITTAALTARVSAILNGLDEELGDGIKVIDIIKQDSPDLISRLAATLAV